MEVPSTFAILAKIMFPAGHKPALQELCGWYVAVTRIVFDGKLWVFGGNGGSGTLNSWNSSDGSGCTKVVVKDNETSISGI